VLGLQEVAFLDYIDGELDQADPAEATAKIVAHLRRVRPQVVITFDPSGAYGHPDHIAICQLTLAAIVAAADPAYERAREWQPYRALKLYYMVGTEAGTIAYQAAFGDLVMEVDGVERKAISWEDWAITTTIDAKAYWPQVWQAVSCHRSQLPFYKALRQLPEEQQANLWGIQSFYRAFSLVNGGRKVENDLFEGIRR
jgi:LmbE family N-acetylglucosaminyl deacetylase